MNHWAAKYIAEIVRQISAETLEQDEELSDTRAGIISDRIAERLAERLARSTLFPDSETPTSSVDNQAIVAIGRTISEFYGSEFTNRPIVEAIRCIFNRAKNWGTLANNIAADLERAAGHLRNQ